METDSKLASVTVKQLMFLAWIDAPLVINRHGFLDSYTELPTKIGKMRLHHIEKKLTWILPCDTNIHTDVCIVCLQQNEYDELIKNS